MAYDMSKDIIIKGIGSGLIRDKITGKVLYWNKGQNLSVEHSTTSEDVYGGDSLLPIYTYATQSETTITFTNATFLPEQLGFMVSSELSTANIKSQDVTTLTKASKKVSTKVLTGVKVLVAVGPDGSPVEVSSSGTAPEEGINVSATGEVTFGASALEGNYRIVYEYDAVGVQTAVLADTLPNPVEVFATFYPEDLDGVKQQMNIYIPHARCDGNVTFETARDSAGTPELTFKVLGQRDKEQVMVITIADIPEEDTTVAVPPTDETSNVVGEATVGKATL